MACVLATIYVASNPKGLEGTFTKGIVSRIREDILFEKGEEMYELAKKYGLKETKVIQLDAAISAGSSGGALLDGVGNVTGIIRSTLGDGQNLNFAIPINRLKVLERRFNNSVLLAGACAYTDRRKMRLQGLVKSVRVKELPRDKSGRPIGNDVITTRIINFDLDGNKTEEMVFQPTDGELALKFSYVYDESRIPTKMVTQIKGGEDDVARFDLTGGIQFKLALREFSQSTGDTERPGGLRTFDSAGNVVAWYLGSGVKYLTEFDASGRERTQTQFRNGSAEIITRYSYVEDDYGNWIERTEFTRYPNTTGVNPNRWLEGDTEYREINYFK